MLWVSVGLAAGFGVITAVPGLLPSATVALVTWSRVVSGIGWLGYGAGVAAGTHVPDVLLPGILAAQIGYGLAVFAIAKRPCKDD
jgi:hypothetical protein